MLELQEPPEAPLYAALEQRSRVIYRQKGLGQPDLCYLVKEFSKTGMMSVLSKPLHKGVFHFIYGADISSQASVAAYFQEFISKARSHKGKVVHGYFCSFDLFSRQDIRTEVKIPGSFEVLAYSESGVKRPVSDMQWKGALLSSILRALRPVMGPGLRVIDPVERVESIATIVEAAKALLPQCGYIFGDVTDTVRYAESLFLPLFSDYLIKGQRLQAHINIFTQRNCHLVSHLEPLMLTYVADAYIEQGHPMEACRVLAAQLIKTPHSLPLLHKEASIFLKLRKYDIAENLAKICVQLKPDSFECWILLAEIYWASRKYSMALIALNTAPMLNSEEEEIEVPAFAEQDRLLSTKVPLDFYVPGQFFPVKFDFRPIKNSSSHLEAKEKAAITALDQLPGSNFSKNEQRVYELLVKIEKDLGWDKLLQIRSRLFLMDSDSGTTHTDVYDGLEPEETIYGDHNESFIVISGHGDALTRDPLHEELKSEPMESIQEEEESEVKMGHLQRPGVPVNPEEMQKKLMLGTPEPTPRDMQAVAELPIDTMQNRKKRLCTKAFDALFNALFHDLSHLYEWQSEESQIPPSLRGDKSAVPYSGRLWVRRGQLAERLCRNRYAERAYRHCIDKGFSMYAWSRLLQLYVESKNPKAVFVCLAEIADQMEIDGVNMKTAKSLPRWMEVALAKTCGNCGMPRLKQLVQELTLESYGCIVATMEKLQRWDCRGTDAT